jgi:hypothetical protein
MTINKLALKAYYENNKDSYWSKRLSGDDSLWDESYKWDILPRLNRQLETYEKITPENAAEIVTVLQKNNPNAGSFCHWTDFDNLSKLIDAKPVAAKALAYIWGVRDDTNIGKEIDGANDLLNQLFSASFKLSPAAFGYMLAAQNYRMFATYNNKMIDELTEINSAQRPTTQGEKYQLFNDSAKYIGELMANDKYADKSHTTELSALNGQDFLYVTMVYGS